MSSPIFSIVIPCYNHGQFLSGAIESVLKQRFSSVEIIVIDDASSDDTSAVAACYGPRIIYVRLEKNVGAGGAWGRGLALSTGDYVCKLDADDEQKEGFLETVLDAFKLDKDIGFVATSVHIIGEKGQVVEEKITEQDVTLDAAQLRSRLLKEFFFRMPGSCVRRNILIPHDPPDTRLYQIHDWEYFLRVSAGYKARLIAKPLAVYRIHQASITRTARTRNLLGNDFETWLEKISSGGEKYLSVDERSILAGSMGVLQMRGTPFPSSPENFRCVINNYRNARRLAKLGGKDQLRRLNSFIAARVQVLAIKIGRIPIRVVVRLNRWLGWRLRRGAELYRNGGKAAALLYIKEELFKNTWLTLNKNRNFRNPRVACNLCGWCGPGFHTHCGAGYVVYNCICPKCGSFPRHRGFAYISGKYLTDKLTEIGNNNGLRLIFAPEHGMYALLSKYLGELKGIDYDQINAQVDVRMDIQQLALADESVDFISSFHVIEHVPDDAKALQELYRILEPRGKAIICVPINFQLTETIEFGRPNHLLEDHYYDYAADFGDRVLAAGFIGTVFRLSEVIPHGEYTKLSLQDELIFWVGKGDVHQRSNICNSNGQIEYA